MTKQFLVDQIKAKQSYLCVGLDTDLEKLPAHLPKNKEGVIAFNKAIIDATAPYCVAFKPNTAFYEAYGITGMESLDNTMHYLHANYPDHFLIADAKRGDIGNTGEMYAQAFFNKWNAHAVTVSPYMGKDSVQPFLSHPNKWAVVLGLTSNAGAQDVQMLKTINGPLYLEVMKAVASWGSTENLMFVTGATQLEQLKAIRKQFPHHFFLIPGIGAQGGSVKDLWTHVATSDIGILLNASRSILYASADTDFADAAAQEARKLQQSMSIYF